jgi:hypothetical protein
MESPEVGLEGQEIRNGVAMTDVKMTPREKEGKRDIKIPERFGSKCGG